AELRTPAGFGHGGATGTELWIEPELDLIFVFLTNRWGLESPPTRLGPHAPAAPAGPQRDDRRLRLATSPNGGWSPGAASPDNRPRCACTWVAAAGGPTSDATRNHRRRTS